MVQGWLKGETVIGLKKIYLDFELFGFEPTYLLAINDKVIAQSAEAKGQLGCTKLLTDRAMGVVLPTLPPFTSLSMVWASGFSALSRWACTKAIP